MTVDTYTADTNSMLCFIADVLPPAADSIYSDALAGDATIQMPPIAAAETAYMLVNKDKIKGVKLRADGQDFVNALDDFLPVTVSKANMDDMRKMVNWLDTFPKQIHDALILANHDARGTKAVITSDRKMRQSNDVSTIWK